MLKNNVINNDRNRWWMYFLLNDKLYITTSLSSAFFHGLWTWFIAFCLADVFNLLQDTFQIVLHIPADYPHGNFFLTYPIQYQPDYISDSPYIGDFSTYISDFFIILTIRHRISTYRQFSATYLCSIPRHYTKRSYPTATSFHIPHFVFTQNISTFLKYIDHFSTYINDFFIISTVQHKISI